MAQQNIYDNDTFFYGYRGFVYNVFNLMNKTGFFVFSIEGAWHKMAQYGIIHKNNILI